MNYLTRRGVSFKNVLAMFLVVSACTLQAGSDEEKLGEGFTRQSKEKAGPRVKGFVDRDGKRFGKIDAFTYSTFLVSGGRCSFVPTDAILHVPEEMEDLVVKEKQGRIILWPTFYRINRNYFHTVEVTPAEFTGQQAISQNRMEQWSKLGRVVIAVYRGNPISVPKREISEAKTAMAD